MTSIERLHNRGTQIYQIKISHKDLQAKDTERKRTAYWEKAKMRSESTEMHEEFRQKE